MAKSGAKVIIAGPGTGKTTKMIGEITQFIEEDEWKEKGFLACTFTRKAAEEFQLRLLSSVKQEQLANRNYLIGTIHSICLELLKEHPSGRYAEYEILTEEQVAPFIFTRLHRLGFDRRAISNLWDFTASLGSIYSLISDQQIRLEDLEFGDDDLIWAICEGYQAYLHLLEKEKLIDFALTQVKLLEVLQSDSDFQTYISKKYSHLFIDEFQDTNPIQNGIFLLLAKPEYKITVVGDDDQSIYAFRGANHKNILNFEAALQGDKIQVKREILSTNFRSTPEIVSLIAEFINSAQINRLKKNLKSSIETNSILPVIAEFPNQDSECDAIVESILDLKSSGAIKKLNEIAILFRTVKFQSMPLQKKLLAKNIPFVVYGAGDFFDRKFAIEFMAVIGFLLSNEQDSQDQLKAQLHEISPQLAADYSSRNYFQALISIKDLLQNYKSCIALFYDAFNSIDYFERHDYEEANLGILSQLIIDFDQNSKAFDIYGLWSYLCYTRREKRVDYIEPENSDAVQIMTIHKSKGLEFHTVFMPNQLDTNPRPSIIDKFREIAGIDVDRVEDEIRLGYVGMTRAKRILWMSCAQKNSSGRELNPSVTFKLARQQTKFYSKHLNPNEFQKIPDVPQKHASKDAGLILSYNGLSSFNFCPRYYMYRHVWSLETLRTGGMQFGTNMHRIVQVINEEISKSFDIEKIDVRNIVELNYQDSWSTPPASQAKYREAAIAQLEVYCKNFLKVFGSVEFLSSEEQFDVAFEDMLLTGRFDLTANINGELAIIDYKSGDESDYSKQVSLYSMCYGVKHDERPKKLYIYYFKSGTLAPVQQLPDHDMTQELMSTRDKIINKDFKPTPGKQCADCSFSSICPDTTSAKSS